MFAKENLGLALIQEPWTYKGQVRGLISSNSDLIWDTRHDSPRACIQIRNNIKFICLSEFMTRDLVPIQTQIECDGIPQTIVVAAVYFPGDEDNIPPMEVQRLVDYCKSNKLPLLVGCDANAHHTAWGSTDINRRGEYLLDFILEKCLDVYNVGNTPTFVTRIREEVLDITFGTSNLGRLVEGWRVSNEPSLSDHRIITFSITRLLTENTSGRNPKKTDWNLYKSVVQINLERIGPARTTKSHLELSGAINEAFELSCPIKPIKSQKDAPWWSKNMSKQRSKVRKLFNEAKRTGELEGYTAELTIYSKEIKKAKRNSFVSFCENTTATPAAARLRKVLAKDKTIKSLALRYNDGSFTENEEQRSTLLLNTHFPGSLPMTGNVIESTTFKPNKTDWKTDYSYLFRQKN
ncbi:uncharacterized protein LOC129909743 [Episyrphus balteatus]|uniref:uncharacterized protein LOC129909743 n=1 Tax=Episyrphus balteatus TaxID=286459 RepID=UPI0024852FC6|nr:uncharacterized protein LOC129909743 [Episyrphus balteatus]